MPNDERKLDARPDRIDLRDRFYEPALVSLPAQVPSENEIESFFVQYSQLVLDQGAEGACTGFGLAATINYLLFLRNGNSDFPNVSERMLYHLARIYDEWPGEDYEGSSCRGAMKGWHRHGVCSETNWPYRDKNNDVTFVRPTVGWEQDAASRTLGAYYRIDTKSIVDMQAAILEVGAIYCSAKVHDGWYLKPTKALPLIQQTQNMTGGHAFAFVGYNRDGFIVQNSWGSDWGLHGFAVMSYNDWVKNGSDAWVAVLGAPMSTGASSRTFSRESQKAQSVAPTTSSDGESGFAYRNNKAKPISEEGAYLRTVVLANNGIPLNKLLEVDNADDAVTEVCRTLPAAYFDDQVARNGPLRLAIFAHGGLNNEEDSIKRIQMLAPYFIGNGIYPLFLTWKTGVMESLSGMLSDGLRNIFQASPDQSDEGFFEGIGRRLREARDRSIEEACERILVRAIWSEMKQNADAAAQDNGGLAQIAGHVASLVEDYPALEVHLVGHSAGSIAIGHLLSKFPTGFRSTSTTLFAPACTVNFANEHYGAALENGVLAPGTLFFDILDDERELADSVGPYGKSLLYLVSRALERKHKTPLLGMAIAIGGEPNTKIWNKAPEIQEGLQKWQDLSRKLDFDLTKHSKNREFIDTGIGQDQIKLAHGSFDNDKEVITKLLKRIRNDQGRLPLGIENLTGY